ncbi:glycoside hydrolase family 5 protein [Haloferula chungangensis]|uniref:Glycoside hydrolase family 5 protein n=1 Tax=Haloferula chungangensis TaxID=1048331 RepID=A0ABW2L2W7_9BACT
MSPTNLIPIVLSLLLSPLVGQSVVAENGLLRVKGSRIVNREGTAVSLAGNSFFWSQWDHSGFWNPKCVAWLVDDWNSAIIRAPMGVEEPGGYLEKPEENERKLRTLVQAAVNEGVYVIIDWHSHYAEKSTAEAVEFFERMARSYGGLDHVIYEIYNEPKKTEWSEIKEYAETVIAAIRRIDPDKLIVVGTGEWSQEVDEPAADPITQWPNIAYTLHFYSDKHGQSLRDRADAALAQGIALFVTEWGPVGKRGKDPETEKWMAWCRKNKISHCVWSVNDKDEPYSIVRKGADPEGGWKPGDLRPAGELERSIISTWNENQ